ncbi:MAG: T9SS type A sorting domain-containing protein [Candidatus Eisenbacteria bacterium]
MKVFLPLLVAGAMLAPLTAHATKYFLAGTIYCEGTGLPLPGVTIRVTGDAFVGSGTSDAAGNYEVALPDAGGEFTATAVLDAGETVIFPAGGAYLFTTSLSDPYLYKNWVIASPGCSKPEGMCWMTGGGARISQFFDGGSAEQTRRHNFGGNVYPGCSPTAGQGGQWNHVDAVLKRHFQGFQITVERCGNVDGLPPGSESPVTPFNFIEFYGTGRVQGIRGNKLKVDPAYFWARVEDRNEPGSNGQRDGTLKDSYFLHVFSDPNDRYGSTLLLVDIDGDPNTIDPIAITDGNLQLHISSCDAALPTAPVGDGASQQRLTTVSNEFWFATAPNPVTSLARIKFGTPRDGRVSFRVFDVSGRMVREISDGMLRAGEHSTSWNLQDNAGQRVGSGMYFVQMKSGGMSRTQRIVVP